MRHEAVLDHGVRIESPADGGMMFRLRRFALEHLMLLPVGVLMALLWANTAAESYYQLVYALDFWVNDVAMVFFFGLLMKEVVEARETGGVLHVWRKATVPVIAAAGAAIFLDERIGLLQFIGGILTIVSVVAFVSRRRLPDEDVVPEGAP